MMKLALKQLRKQKHIERRRLKRQRKYDKLFLLAKWREAYEPAL